MGKGHVVLAIEPTGLVPVSEQLTDLTYLRFDDSDPVLAHGSSLLPSGGIQAYIRLCGIRNKFNIWAVEAMRDSDPRLIEWHRFQCRSLDMEIDYRIGAYVPIRWRKGD